jgi:hypothetical protein
METYLGFRVTGAVLSSSRSRGKKTAAVFLVPLLLGILHTAHAESAWDKLKAVTEVLQQQHRQTAVQQSTSRSAVNRSAGQDSPSEIVTPSDFGTPKGTARIAAASGYLDVVGIKIGMGMKAALNALKAHRSNLTVQPLSLYRYEAMPDVSMIPVIVAQTDPMRSEAYERISLEFTYSPNDPFLWSISRDIGFTNKEAPTRDNVLAGLRKKYGQESFQYVSDQYVWIFDAQGHLVSNPRAQSIFQLCSSDIWMEGMGGISAGGNSPTADNHLGNSWYDQQLKGGYYFSNYGRDTRNGTCQSYSVVHVRLPELASIGQAQGLVRGMLIRVSNRQLEASGVQASHAQLVQAADALEEERKSEAAKRAGPEL